MKIMRNDQDAYPCLNEFLSLLKTGNVGYLPYTSTWRTLFFFLPNFVLAKGPTPFVPPLVLFNSRVVSTS